jgi:hypothetical protein
VGEESEAVTCQTQELCGGHTVKRVVMKWVEMAEDEEAGIGRRILNLKLNILSLRSLSNTQKEK